MKERAFLGFAGALVVGLGVATLLQGKLHYQNCGTPRYLRLLPYSWGRCASLLHSKAAGSNGWRAPLHKRI